MKSFQKTLTTILSFVLCAILFVLPVFAQGSDGLDVTLKTDKDAYGAAESVSATLTVVNNSSEEYTNLRLDLPVPGGFKSVSGDQIKYVESLRPGSSVEISAVYAGPGARNAQTGDTMIILLALAALTCVVLLTALMIHRKALRRNVLSVILCFCMLGGAFVLGIGAKAAELSEDIVVEKTITVGEQSVTLQGKVSQEEFSHDGLTATQLDALPTVHSDEFENAMNVTWNFGWEGDASLEHNATKVDFDGSDAGSLKWRTGVVSSEDGAHVENGGWGVVLWTKGTGNVAFMYNKVDVPEYTTHFRVWAVGNTSEHWSGSGAFRAVAVYRADDGNFAKKILTPKAESFVGNMTTTADADGYVHFSRSSFNIPDTLDDCMVLFDADGLQGRKDVVIFIESKGIGEKQGSAAYEELGGVPANDTMPDVVIVKRAMFMVEIPQEPVKPTAIYHNMTAEDLDALPTINGAEFDNSMNAMWNFSWEGATPERTAEKVDFDGSADAASLKWRVGTEAGEGLAHLENAGWGVLLWTKGEGNQAYMYSKLDVPATMTQFRIWAAGLTNEHWSGNGALRAVAVYKDGDNYVKEYLEPIADSFIGDKTTTYNAADGTVRYHNASGWTIPDVLDGGMLIYNMDKLKGRNGVVIFVESVGTGEKFGTAATEEASGVPNGELMPETIVIKRIMFLG